MKQLLSFGFTLAFLTATGHAFNIQRKFTEMCGRNVTLVEPNESLRVDFNVPEGQRFLDSLAGNCTSFIVWSGPGQFKLLPYMKRLDSPVLGVDDHPQVVLSITELNGKVIKLDMFGAKPFYLSVTPVQKTSLVKDGMRNAFHRCPANYIGCGQHLCLHSQFFCDSTSQCATDELTCFEMPTNLFLVLSFAVVMFAFAVVSALLGLYVYFKFYRNTAFLLSADYKPQYYGTVNGTFDSSNSIASLLQGQATSPIRKQTQFYDNIRQQHYYENLSQTQK